MKRLLILFLVLFLPAELFAGEGTIDLLKEGMGPRAIAMGGAFSSISNNIYAPSWNPAGIGDITKITFGSNYSSLISDITRFGLLGTWPMFDGCFEGSIIIEKISGALLTTVGNDGRPELQGTFDDSKWVLALTYARQAFIKGLLLGGNFKYYIHNLSSASGNGIGFDVGAIYYPLSKETDNGPLGVGLTVRNPLGTKIKWGSGNVDSLSREFVIGANYSEKFLDRKYVLSGDFAYGSAKKICVGAEYWLTDVLPIRFGINKERNLTFGTGVKMGQIDLDISYFNHPDLGSNYQFAFSYVFDLKKVQKEIIPEEKKETEVIPSEPGKKEVAPAPLEDKKNNYVISTNFANIRKGPGINFPVLCVKNKNEEVTVIGELANWYQIEGLSEPAWINKNLVKKKE